MRRRQAAGLALVLVGLLSISLSAQRITRRVFVTAISGGAPVLDLTAADFQVVENGTTREVTRAALGKEPMRIVLLVDSSTAVAQMLTQIRAALTAFFDTLPPEHEVVFISTGGQIRVRAQPTTDRSKLKTEAGRFSSDGGGNSLIETLLESDRRFLRQAAWPVIVIVTTDNGDARTAPRIEEYNRFMDDFLLRGGSAHGIVVRGKGIGPISDITENLIQNTAGLYEVINQSTAVEARLKVIAERLASDHAKMANAYAIDYPSEGKIKQPVLEVGTGRGNVTLKLWPRRPL
jgi:hypothetical protein